jgi:organic radical activating enzyme
MYQIKEIFYTLQGEGQNAGRPAIFCRFAGCNLWSGQEADRAKAECQFCDTDFVGTDGPDRRRGWRRGGPLSRRPYRRRAHVAGQPAAHHRPP